MCEPCLYALYGSVVRYVCLFLMPALPPPPPPPASGLLMQESFTPLLIAAANGHVEVVRLLLAAGVNKEAANEVSGTCAAG